jgi:PAS domain S-box-containing protein
MGRGSEREHETYGDSVSSEARDQLLAATADVLLTLDEEGTILSVTDEAPSTLGYSSDQLVGQPIRSLFATDTPPSSLFDVTTAVAFETAVLNEERVTAPIDTADEGVAALSLSTVARPGTTGLVCLGQDRSVDVRQSREETAVSDLFDAVPDPVYALDADGCLERVNEAFATHTGYDRSELLGRRVAEILPASEYQRATRQLTELLSRDETTGTFETAFLTKDGKRVVAEANVALRTAADGSYAGSVGVLRDIRERKNREQTLELLKQILTRVFRHNVRNELMVAQGHAELLQQNVDEDLQKHTAQILETADRLLNHSEKAHQIEEVIEVDEQTNIDLTEKVTHVVEAARSAYPGAEIEADLPETAVVDAHPNVESAIEELVENAVVHAPAGDTPRVELWLERRGGTQTLFVEDESGGLSDHEVNVLEDGSEDDLEHSSGVGLWLVRWLVELSEAELFVHRTEAGTLMGIRFGQDASTLGLPDAVNDSPLARAPAHVRDLSPEHFRDDTVIGRVDALGQLEDIYDSLAHTGGHSVLVTGGAGIGKTTLVEQFCDRIETTDDDVLVATGYCDSDVQPPYHAVSDAFRDLPGERAVPEILGDTATGPAGSGPGFQQRKRALFATVADEIREIATDRPVVFLLEDIQWADQATLDLFEYLVDEVGQWSHPVLFVATYRTSDVDETHPVLAIAEETADAGRGTVIELEPFGEAEVASLLSYMLGVEELPASLVESVHDHTGGTPLFVNELGRHLVDTLGPVQAATDLPATLDDITVPETVESTIAERLAVLPDDVYSVLRLGAVIGREFSFDLLWEASNRPVDALIECSNALVRREIWRQTPDGIEFIHGVVREQVLERLPADERAALHDTVATAIEDLYPDTLEEYAGRLGSHYEAVGEYDAAFEYYRQAAQQEAATYANEDAIEHFERALSLAREHGVADAATRGAVLAAVGGVYERRGDYDQAREAYESSLARYRESGDGDGEIESLHSLGDVAQNRGSYDRAQEYYEDGLALAAERNDRSGEADCLYGLGSIAYERGGYDEARAYYEQSLETARDCGDRETEAASHMGLGGVAWRQGEYDRARDSYGQSLAIQQATDDRYGQAESLMRLGNIAFRRGAYDEAQEYYERSIEIRREIGDRNGEAELLTNIGLVMVKRGAFTQAREYYEQSLAIKRESGDRNGQALILNNLSEIAIQAGDYDEAEADADESLALKREIGDRNGEASSLNNRGVVARDRGNYDQARDRVADSLAIFEDIGNRTGEATSQVLLASIALSRGAFDRAAEHAAESLAIYEEIGSRGGKATSLLRLGQTANRRGHLAKADEYLTDALEIARDIGDVQRELQSLRELAAVARTRQEYDRAIQYLDDARATDGADGYRLELARLHLERTRLALAREDPETARDALEAAESIFDDLDTVHHGARATALRGRVAAETDALTSAREHWADALETFQRVGAPQDTLATLRRLVDACRRQGEDEQADTYREHAQAVFESAPDTVQAAHEDWLGVA